MKKILISVLTLLTIGTACFAGCMEPSANSNGGNTEVTREIINETTEEENDGNGDGEEKPVPPPCEKCKPPKRHGGRPKPMPKPEPEPAPQN